MRARLGGAARSRYHEPRLVCGDHGLGSVSQAQLGQHRAVLLVLPILGNVLLNSHWQRRLDRYSPMDAGLAIQATRKLSKLPIGPWQGLGVLGLWTAAAVLAGWLAFRCRDA